MVADVRGNLTQALAQVDAKAPVATLPEVGDLLCGKFDGGKAQNFKTSCLTEIVLPFLDL